MIMGSKQESIILRILVCEWCVNNLCGIHLGFMMNPTQIVEMLTILIMCNSSSKYFNQWDDQFH